MTIAGFRRVIRVSPMVTIAFSIGSGGGVTPRSNGLTGGTRGCCLLGTLEIYSLPKTICYLTDTK